MVYEMFCFVKFYEVCFLLLVCPRTRTYLIYFCSKSLYLYGSTPLFGAFGWTLLSGYSVCVVFMFLIVLCSVLYFCLCFLVNVIYLPFCYAFT